VAVEVVRDGRQPGSRPGQRGGSAPGCNHLGRTFGAGEVADGGVLSWVTFLKHRLLHVAEALGVVVEREVVVEVESAAMRERLALAELRIAELVNRPGVAKPYRPAKRAKVRAGARRTASMYGAPAKVRAGGRREDGFDNVVPFQSRPPRVSLSESLASVLRPAKRAAIRAGAKKEDGL
jgi:hypothetical protein